MIRDLSTPPSVKSAKIQEKASYGNIVQTEVWALIKIRFIANTVHEGTENFGEVQKGELL